MKRTVVMKIRRPLKFTTPVSITEIAIANTTSIAAT